MYDSSSGLQQAKSTRRRRKHARLYADKHGNLSFEVGRSKLELLWDPYLNSSALQNEIVSGGSSSQNNFPLHLKGSQRFIAVGGRLWHARHPGEDCLTAFEDNIGALLDLSRKKNIFNSTTLTESQKRLLLFMPVLSPDYDKTCRADRKPYNMVQLIMMTLALMAIGIGVVAPAGTVLGFALPESPVSATNQRSGYPVPSPHLLFPC
jgi:hypothetical protein